jgi:2-C-methyl-D-erythritol 2,4-cyclodiphosphate synthase
MLRVGIGYDVHRTAADRPLVLGGVTIPFQLGLTGHSDADVILHALIDALLGAAALGDIGRHFPASDEAYRDASSLALLATVRDLLGQEGFTVVNADIVVVAEEPRLAPYVDEMRRRIAGVLRIDPAAVSVKATTNEQVGPEGRKEAISARAVALLERTQ